MNSIDYFDTIAQDWDSMRSRYFKDDITPLIHTHLDFTNRTVVDLGSGTGYIATLASKSAKHVFAVDQSSQMLTIINNLKQDNITTLQSSFDTLPLASETVDIVTINMALHHVENPLKTMQEAFRILKPGGLFFISDPMQHSAQWAHEEMKDTWLGFSLNQIETWLTDASFANAHVYDTKLQAHATSTQGDHLIVNIFIAVAIKGAHHEI